MGDDSDKKSTMHLSGRKINRDDYNIFISGIQHAFGSQYGITDSHISAALRHYGKHLLNDDIDHINNINQTARQSRTTKTVIFEPISEEDDEEKE